MKLLIVESPSKAKTINKYLGKDFNVISSFGHIRGLPSEDGSVRPEEDFAMTYAVNPKSQKQVTEIVKNVKNADEILLATDPDREGEAISWHIVEVLKERKSLKKDIPVRRVVFHEITKKAVQAAVDDPRDMNMDLVRAQQARQALDYLVGFTLSPVLWRKLPGSRSAGRVQSVALRVICDREAEIEAFKSEEYWSITGNFLNVENAKFTSTLTHLDGEKLEKFSINNEKDAKAAVKSLEGLDYSVGKVEKKQARRNPYAPFTTSTMLQEAARKLGFSAKKTSRMAQDLYEGVDVGGDTIGLITYMRTDSVTISQDALNATRNHIGSEYGDKYLPKSPRMYKTKTKNAQEAHEAIRPTDVSLTPAKLKNALDSDHFKLYDLIWKRLIASQMESAVLDIVSADIESSDKKAVFRATGSTIVFDGYYKIYKEGTDDSEEEDSKMLPPLTQGDASKLEEVIPNQHFTQPPPRYSEASLVKKMEELGIGRPSTYPGIISILQERDYVRLEKKRFMPEVRGRIVNSFLICFFPKYVEYDFTANLEDELDHVSNGEMDWKKVLKEFWDPFKLQTDAVLEIKNPDIINEIEKLLERYIFDGDEDKSIEEARKCPKCSDGKLELKAGKFGAFVGCSNYPECKHTGQIGQSHSEGEGSASDEKSEFPKVLGDDGDGNEVTIRKGPYGIYVQRGTGKAVKRTGVPKHVSPDNVDLDYALGLLSLPRVLGMHPDTGNPVSAGIGRYGPYVEHEKVYRSLKDDDPVSIGIGRAVDILMQPKPTRKKK